MIRLFDIFISILCILFAWPLIAVVALLIYFDGGQPFFKQERVGRDQKPFVLLKFRTMKIGTASIATHLADAGAITFLGGVMRRTKLDELPQLWNVLKGEMSLVGPRPCLFNQTELITQRALRGVYKIRPGITGLAQINQVDMSTPILVADLDAKLLESLTLRMYFYLLIQTLLGRGSGDRINISK